MPITKSVTEDDRHYHLVMRYIPIFSRTIDVLSEHQRVLSEKHVCCFGKMGKAPKQATINILNTQIKRGINTYAYFVSSGFQDGRQHQKKQMHRMRLKAVSRNPDNNFVNYAPSYYTTHELYPLIRFWLLFDKIEPFEPHELWQFYIAQTGTDMKYGLAHSSSGFFIVTKKQPIEATG